MDSALAMDFSLTEEQEEESRILGVFLLWIVHPEMRKQWGKGDIAVVENLLAIQVFPPAAPNSATKYVALPIKLLLFQQ